MKKILILFWFAIIVFPGYSESTNFPFERFSDIYNLKIDTSHSSTMQSDNPYDILAEDYHDFFFLLLSGNEKNYQQLKISTEKRIERIESGNSENAIKDFCIAEIELHWALLYWRFGDYVKSGLFLRRAYKRLEELQRNEPEMKEVNKSLGLLHILLSAIPDEFNWLIKIFGFENNFERGMKELKIASTEENPFIFESKLLLSYVQIFVLDKKEEGFAIIEEEINGNKSLIAPFVYLIYCHKDSENEKGLSEIYKERWIFAPKSIKPFLSLLRGEMHLKKLEYEQAIFNFKDFLFTYHGKGFRSNVNLKLFYAYYLSGQNAKAEELLNSENSGENELIVSDKYASDFFERKKEPNKILLTSRLLFDGGYYEKAQKEVINYAYLSKYDEEFQIEYYYRRGRIEQKLNNTEPAINSFEKCIEIQGNRNLYFAPNSCLQLGHIFMKTGNRKKAEEYFSRAISYRNYAYRRSIEHQAKTALNSLRSL